MKAGAVLGVLACLAATTAAQEVVTEPATGMSFRAREGEMTLLGVGVRTRTVLKVKAYAIGLYVADSALRGPLARHKGSVGSPAFYRDLVWGDFPKKILVQFARNVGRDRIQEAMREALAGADPARIEAFVAYFPQLKEGEECTIRWVPGGVLEITMAGALKPPIADRAFAAAVYSVWLGEKSVQEDLKRRLVDRTDGLLD